MHHKFWLMCVSLAVLWAAVSTDTGQTVMATSTLTVQQQKTTSTPQTTTLLPSRSLTTLNVSTDANTESSPAARNVSTNTNIESSQAARNVSTDTITGSSPATRNVSTNTNTEISSAKPSASTHTNTESFDRTFGRQQALDAPEPTGRASDLMRNTKVKDSDYTCGCPTFSWACVCTNPTGKIVNNPAYSDPITWTFEVDDVPISSPILVKVYFYVSDVPKTDRNWKLNIGSKSFQKTTELLNKTEVYILSNEMITYNKTDDNLSILLYYEALAPVHVTETIPRNDLYGIIRFPNKTSENDDLGYIQQLRQMWIFNYPENCTVELNITKLDLGYRQADLHWKNTFNDETENDFLLIGLGTEILESMDKVMYGHLDEMKTIRVNHPSAHIVLFSSYHEQWAGGFEISYAALEVTIPSTTPTVPPTTPAPQLGVLPSTLAPIDGALKGNYSEMRSSFRSAVAGMATKYVSTTGLDVESPSVIESSEVVVHWTATCMQETCSKYCAAFNFSIHKETRAGSAWAFSAHTLNLMIRDETLQSYWKVINDECEFCEETVTVNWYVFGGVAAGAVLLAVIISLVVWKIKNIAAAKKSKQEIEEDQKQEELERRRRSSGDESVIGGLKGGARMSLPFGAARGSVNSGHSSQDEETDDYPEHDPDFGYDTFGLGADLLNDNRAKNFYSNAAFEPDSTLSDNIGYKQLHQVAFGEPQPSTSSKGLPLKPIPILKSSMKKRTINFQEADETPTTPNSTLRTSPKKVITVVEEEDEESFTDSDNSDGTVQFQSSAFGVKKHISIQADVHHPGDSEFGESKL